MTEQERISRLLDEFAAGRITRRELLFGLTLVTGSYAMAASLAGAAGPEPRGAPAARGAAAGGAVVVRWLGGGVVEVATSDYKQVAYIDAWLWNNAGWERFGVAKPPEYTSPNALREYLAAKAPEAVFVLLTHDHADHMGDYLELLATLTSAGLPVKTCGQSDLMRAGLVQRFRDAGLDPTQVVVHDGAGINFGGRAQHGAMTVHLVPAIHSTLAGYPAAGFILDIGGVRLYASGDTDLYGDLRLVGDRYQPDVALICCGDGPFTMGPRDAALTCQLVGVTQAVPIHYAHSALVLGPQAGEAFQQALAELAPNVTAHVLQPGEARTLTT
jgi:L-ascorbate metabolism protein UlaG (beta-lactamase superfamily)